MAIDFIQLKRNPADFCPRDPLSLLSKRNESKSAASGICIPEALLNEGEIVDVLFNYLSYSIRKKCDQSVIIS